ncbi:alpha/beta hydrolase [Niveispirillum lacus]|uniref:Alpha/beta hydrolase n=1 Tax=Niveispirillum lacus TaxID=1981099 RepID=A0A255Z022_9PROT|nr:alpha/beta hydrolase [Niveispirillum lacus]OYQ34853.1 alpha/beta hydrolase [Niveispirillum lacus]
MRRVTLLLASLLLSVTATAAGIEAPGPQGPLRGTWVDAGSKSPVVLMIPGSGPTDRDSNNPLGVKAASFRLLAEGLAAKGVSSVRIDKRGMFGSASAIPDPNAVTIDDYVTDSAAWVTSIRKQTGAACVWLLGHSEGGLVAVASAGKVPDLCGLILISAPGRPLEKAVMEQLRANPAFAPYLAAAEKGIETLKAGKRVDPVDVPAPLMPLFAPQVQGFLISLYAQDPAALLAKVNKPVLIIHGDQDIQVSVADAEALKAASPKATLMLIPGMTHALKTVSGSDRAANIATYTDPNLPLTAGLVEAVADFVTAKQ